MHSKKNAMIPLSAASSMLMVAALAIGGCEKNAGTNAAQAGAQGASVQDDQVKANQAANDSAQTLKQPTYDHLLDELPQPVARKEYPVVEPTPVEYELASAGLPKQYMWKCDPIFRDINADGYLDLLAIPRLGKGPRIWLGDGGKTWTMVSKGLEQSNSCGGGIEVGDVNEDGRLDMVVADHCDGLFVYLAQEDGSWLAIANGVFPESLVYDDQEHIVQMFVGAEDVDLGDLDGDGHLDIVTCASDEGGINVFFGDGTGKTWNHRSNGLPSDGWANRVMARDMDGDGDLDIIASHSIGLKVWHNDGTGFFGPASDGLPEPMLEGIFHGLDIADVNGDSRPDIVVANWIDGPEMYFQNEDHSWTRAPTVFKEMNGGSQGVALGDVDGDGHLDLAVTGRLEVEYGLVRGVYLLTGDGTGKNWMFRPDSKLPLRGLFAMTGTRMADINGDGILDIAASSGLGVESSAENTTLAVEPRLIVWTGKAAAKKNARAANN